jgi:hypothetical protein
MLELETSHEKYEKIREFFLFLNFLDWQDLRVEKRFFPPVTPYHHDNKYVKFQGFEHILQYFSQYFFRNKNRDIRKNSLDR